MIDMGGFYYMMKSTTNFHQTKRERHRQEERRKKQPGTRQKKQQGRQRPLNRQFLTLAETLQDAAKALHALALVSPANGPAQEPNETDILLELYHGNYFPQSNLCRKNDPLDKNARKTLNALYAALSPEQKNLYLQYEAAENARGAALSERAYKDGFRLAVQLILAGLEPAETL